MIDPAPDSIVLTGCGWVTPFAAGDLASVLRAAADANPPSSDASEAYWSIPDDRVKDYPQLTKEARQDKGTWVTAIALEYACETASLIRENLDQTRTGLSLGIGLAGQLGMIGFANEVRAQSARFVSPIHFPQTVGNYIAGALARCYGIRGPNVTLASGAASGLQAILEAGRLIADGAADVVYAGGCEVLSPALAQSLADPNACLSEGACVFVLEKHEHAQERGAAVLAQVSPRDGSESEVNSTKSPDEAILATTGPAREGVVYVEKWIGRCVGALGAASLAAAIGAAQGLNVPMLYEDEHGNLQVKDKVFSSSHTNRLIVSAIDLNAFEHSLKLEIPPD